MTKQEWAAWAQAVGTVVAVGGGAGTVYWQVHKQRKLEEADRRSEEVAVLNATLGCLRAVDSSLRTICAALQELDGESVYHGMTDIDAVRMLDDQLELLQSTPLTQVPGMNLRSELVATRNAIRHLRSKLTFLASLDSFELVVRTSTLNDARRAAGHAAGLTRKSVQAFEAHLSSASPLDQIA